MSNILPSVGAWLCLTLTLALFSYQDRLHKDYLDDNDTKIQCYCLKQTILNHIKRVVCVNLGAV